MTPATAETIAAGARALAAGQLVAFPTETVYGLGADALNPDAVARIFEAKGRPSHHPLIVHVSSLAAARALAADWPESAERLARKFWPGPLTLLVRRAGMVPDAVTGGQDTVGLRWPSHPTAQRLLEAFSLMGSGAVAAPSANRFGGVSPSLASHVQQSLGPWLTEGDLILDDGPCGVGIESTILDCTVTPARLLRPGGLSREKIEAEVALAVPTAPREVSTLPRVSGSLASHYAPRTPLLLMPADQIQAYVDESLKQSPQRKLLCWVRQLFPLHDPRVSSVLMPRSPDAVAHQLYARLHEWDSQGFDQLVIEEPPASVEWEAIRDRLVRAASGDGASRTPGTPAPLR
ncbi:MAG: Threonylcarbamoyl-AMP synthase [Pseudomonadota bacterium]